MNPHRFDFIKQKVSGNLSDKTVLEVGSRDIRGSIRDYIETLQPKEYVGIDIIEGKGVDVILDIHNLVNHFGENVFDMVICSDTLEHIEKLESAAVNMHGVLKTGGILIVSVPMFKTRYHGFPHDYWRFTLADLRYIFRDMKELDADDTEGVIIIFEKQASQGSFTSDRPIHSILRGKPIVKHTVFDKKALSIYRKNMLILRKFLVRYTPRSIKNIVNKSVD